MREKLQHVLTHAMASWPMRAPISERKRESVRPRPNPTPPTLRSTCKKPLRRQTVNPTQSKKENHRIMNEKRKDARLCDRKQRSSYWEASEHSPTSIEAGQTTRKSGPDETRGDSCRASAAKAGHGHGSHLLPLHSGGRRGGCYPRIWCEVNRKTTKDFEKELENSFWKTIY